MPESCVIEIERIQNKKLFIGYAFQKALLLDKNFDKKYKIQKFRNLRFTSLCCHIAYAIANND